MKVIIVHGIPGNEERVKSQEKRTYDKHWIPWIKQELSKKNIETSVPLMPEPWNPDYKSWTKEFEKLEIDENTILIGHSGGCAFLVRWLGEYKKKIKKLILVAPWKIPSEEFTLGENDLYNFEINKELKDNINDIVIFTSNDEEENGKKSAKIYSDYLDGNLIELENHGHYCFGDMGTKQFPELLSEILK